MRPGQEQGRPRTSLSAAHFSQQEEGGDITMTP